jgi:hypothetical protein
VSFGLLQWRNVISGGPRFKIFEGPLVEVLKARVKRHICTSFLGGPGHVHPENFWIYTLWNAISRTLGRDFTEFWWSKNDIVTYQRPWPMFLLYRLRLGAPIWPIEVGGPRVLPVWAHSSYATGLLAHYRKPPTISPISPGLIYFRKRFLMGFYKGGGAYIRVGLYMDDLLC